MRCSFPYVSCFHPRCPKAGNQGTRGTWKFRPNPTLVGFELLRERTRMRGDGGSTVAP